MLFNFNVQTQNHFPIISQLHDKTGTITGRLDRFQKGRGSRRQIEQNPSSRFSKFDLRVATTRTTDVREVHPS